MKSMLFTLLVLSFALLTFIGCDQGEKAYSYTAGGACVEIITSDKDLQDAAEAAGYSEGACSSDGVVGTCEDYASFEGDSFDAVFYDSAYTASTAELSCSFIGGTWSAE